MDDLKRTPFHPLHEAAGARLVPFAGFEMPVTYSGLMDEHRQVRRSVGLFDVSHMGEVRVRGPHAEDALMWWLTNAIRRIRPGEGQYNVMCNEEGGTVDDVFVYRLAPEDFLVCVNAANRDKDFAWMKAHNPHGAELVDEGDQWGQLAIQGPDAVKVVGRLTEAGVTLMPERSLVRAPFAGVDGCIIARTGYTGEDGFEVFLPMALDDHDTAGTVWNAILEAGEEFDILPVGLGARDTLRLEVGNVLYGHELSETLSPLQAGLRWVVKLRKPGGFIGCEALQKRRETDTHRLVHLVLDGRRIARDDMTVLVGEREVGWVSSGTRGPSVEKSIAMAYVERDFTEPGTRLSIQIRKNRASAEVVEGRFTEQESS